MRKEVNLAENASIRRTTRSTAKEEILEKSILDAGMVKKKSKGVLPSR